MDRLTLKNLLVSCIIGDLPHERENPQNLRLNVTVFLPLAAVGISDSLTDTVDYAILSERISQTLKDAKCRMIERAAELVAALCLEYKAVKGVRVEVEKNGAIENLGGAVVQIERGEIFHD